MLTAFGLTLGLMLLVAGAAADRGGLFPIAVLVIAGLAVGALSLIFPRGPLFALGAANGLAMYTCLYVVLGRAGFPDAEPWAQPLGFLLPVLAFVLACWICRHPLRRFAQQEDSSDLAHLPRFARWLAAVAGVGVISLALPIGRMDPAHQTLALLAAMALVAAISVASVGDVVRLLVDMAAIFEAVAGRLAQLLVPITAYASLWALLTVVFGCLYRIADGLSMTPLFHNAAGTPQRLGFTDAVHFSVVTLSTVGYGDIQPADDGIRVLAGIEMLFAQLLLLFGFYEIMRGSRTGFAAEEAPPAASRTPHSIPAGPARHGAAGGAAPPPPGGRRDAAAIEAEEYRHG
ncbi:MAG TPA: ion channel [Crenalkalicoccus sp.]|nr:ion channel [Crenalkalicoccus sp.]